MSENVKKNTEKMDAVEKDGKTMNITSQKLAVIITAAILALAIITLGVVSLVSAIVNDKGFDYLKSDLSKYIEFNGDYKNFEVNIDLAKARDIDVDVTILNMLCEDKPETTWHSGEYILSSHQIRPGDVVVIWYRGYILDNDGNPIEVDGMSNFGNESAAELEIGGNSFVPGFELDLVGVNTGDYNKFEKITSGSVKDGQVVYVSYSRLDFAEDNTSTQTSKTNVRIDLSDETIDEKYGQGFRDKLLSLVIGTKTDFNTKIGNKSVSYKDLTVSFATECESNPIKVECYFPYDYSNKELRNEDAIFEVYVEKVKSYYKETPEFTDEYLKGKIESGDLTVTLEDLEKHEGATLVEKYRAYATDLLDKIYEEEYVSYVEEAVWDYYESIAKAKKYPKIKVDEMYNSYLNELQDLYNTNQGQIYDSLTGQYKTYSTLGEYATAYFNLDKTQTWQEYLQSLSEKLVLERMVLYYLIRTENLVPNISVVEDEKAKIKQEYLDEYIAQYLDYYNKTEADYTAEEFEQLKADRANEIFSYYDDAHFEERAYYGILARELVKWPSVKTLDERRAYPVGENK